MAYKILGIFILAISMFSCNRPRAVQLNPGFTIYLNDTTSASIKNAVALLQRDLEKVLGMKATIETSINNPDEIKNSLIVINELANSKIDAGELEGFEKHRLFVKDGNLVLQGSDTRGTIYALMTFSEQFLGIEPLWFWALHEPAKQEEILVSASYSFDSGEPYVKYRTWFPNDTDMFSPWRNESQRNKEIWLETMLRLKLNTVETGSSSDYSSPYAISDYTKLIDRFGLKVTYHHVSALNSPYSKWEDYWRQYRGMEPPELLISNETQLQEFWRYNVRSVVRNNIDPIWVINFRGNRDIPFWETFTDAPESMEERAEVINRMVREQVRILKEETKQDDPLVRMIFYNELSDLLAEGLVIPPNEKNLIWNFVAARRDHFPNEDIRTISIPESTKLGYYMNLQFTSTGSHLAQAEGPWKMEKNYRYVDSKNRVPLFFSVMNAGNVREHLLTLSANADLLWRWDGYDSDDFLVNFCTMYFGQENDSTIASLYRDYFMAYWNQKENDLEGFERQYIFHDLRYKQAIRQISDQFFEPVNMNPLEDYSSEQVPNRTFRIVPEDNNANNQIEAIIHGTERSYNRFHEVSNRADSIYLLLDNRYKTFFNDNLRWPSYFMMYLNESLLNYCQAYIQVPGEKQQHYLKKALSAAMDARESIHKTAHNQFVNWYTDERIFDLDDYIERIDRTLKTCLHITSDQKNQN